MKVSLDWLSDFVTFTERDPQAIAARLTEATGEVDEVISLGGHLEHCVIGKVLSVVKHPNADKLSLVDVATDRGTKRVVCGGTNVRIGMTVAFAHVGARVKWHGGEVQTLQKTKIRGEESEGMICAAEELDLQHLVPADDNGGERPILDLRMKDAMVGKPLAEALGLTDTVLHVDNHAITHRADLFSHVGFARECRAIGIAEWKKNRETRNQKRVSFPKTPLPFRCINDLPTLIPRYEACLLTIDSLGSTPDWMQKRLEVTGWRSVNLPVDITNYVMMELGMPLHAFDADDFQGDIVMRLSKAGERVRTLDLVDRTLPEGSIVIADDAGIFDLLGIMGGLRSAIKDTTKMIYLHAAILDPVTIRRTIIATGHRTDASTVYEKGVPRVRADRGLRRALELFLELVPGAQIASRLESEGDDGAAKPITLTSERLASMLGTEIPEKKIIKILEDLEFTVKPVKRLAMSGKRLATRSPLAARRSFAVTPPLDRLGDIRGEHDLIEEVGRIVGYNALPVTMPVADVRLAVRDQRLHSLRDSLHSEEYVEILPLSLTSRTALHACDIDARHAVAIGNPLGEELGILSPSLLPGLLAHAQRNLGHAGDALRTFHAAHVFHAERGEWHELALLFCAKGDVDLLHEPLLLLKQHLERALGSIGFSPEITPVLQSPPSAHPGRFGTISVLGTLVGEIYEVHPSLRERFDLPARAATARINLTELLALPSAPRIAKPLPVFPEVVYDETMPVSQKEHIGPLLRELRGTSELLASVAIHNLFSVSRHSDAYNLTLRFTYRAPDRTLTEEEAQAAHGKVMATMKKEYQSI